MTTLQKYANFIKLEHTLFSIPLLFAGALLAKGEWPSFRLSLLIIIAGAGARVVALVFNRVIDRHIDQRNPRTKDRHLAKGTMSLFEACLTAILGLAVYLYVSWLISDFCLKLSWIPLVGFIAYPYFKRFTKWTHVGLGIVWSLVPIAGFFAVSPSVNGIGPCIMLGLFSIFWLAGFDIIYATLDEESDRENGVFSLPAKWGSKKALRTAAIFHALAFLILLILYMVWLSGPITVMLLSIIGVLLIIEQYFSNYVDLAFFQINTIIGFFVMFFILSGLKGV